MRISAIRFVHLPPFEEVVFEFPKKEDPRLGEVHIITGQNGTGKTRFLCALACVLGNETNLVARISLGSIEFRAVIETLKSDFLYSAKPNEMARGSIKLGQGVRVLNETIPFQLLHRSSNELGWQQVDFPHFRKSLLSEKEFSSALAIRGTTKINDFKVEPMKAIPISDFSSNLDFDRADQSEFILQAITNLKMTSAMEHLSQEPDDSNSSSRSTQIMSRIEAAVSAITGKKFSFKVVPHPAVSIRVRWGNDDMNFGILPDGLRSVIGFLVLCASRLSVDFPEHDSPLDIPIVILLDEPETHLHPAWQQRLIPAAQQLLPNSQMFVVTHSPFIVSSVNSGYVHVLSEKDGKVSVSGPMPCSKGDTWVDAVEDALGLKTWYDPETESMLTKFRSLRQAVVTGKGSVEELKSLAAEIASRSESLSQMMGRELAQVRQICEKVTAS